MGKNMTDNKRKIGKILNIVFLFLLAAYPMRHIWLGVELTDGLYSAGNYRFLERINKMWLFSTYFANAAGSFLSGLPGGDTLIGLRFYTSLFISMTAVFSYLFFTKVVKVNALTVFFGELLALSLCWCPSTILYNYMTYFFFNLTVIVLYTGLVREKRCLLFTAGLFLGMNVLVRFPNLTEAALILSVWYYGWLQRKRFKDVLQETGICLLGFLAGSGLVLLSVVLKYGLAEYVDGIVRMFQIPSEASDYTLYSMVLTLLLDYKASSRWLICMVLLAAAGCLISAFVYRAAGDKDAAPGSPAMAVKRGLGIFGKLCFIGGIVVLFRWWHSLGIFNIKYYTYECMFQWVAVFLILSIITGIVILFSKKTSHNEKLLSSMILILIGVTPLGSNNHLYPNMNNMFLVFPFVLFYMGKFLQKLKCAGSVEFGRQKAGRQDKKRWKASLYPVWAMSAVFLSAMSIQCLLFGAVFTFRDGMSGQKRDTRIEKNDILKGTVTNKELAEAVEELTVYIETEGLSDREVLLYGEIPAVSYILNMPSAISTTWPDLASYNYEIMAEDMERLRAAVSEGGAKGTEGQKKTYDAPVIILGGGLDGFLRGDEEAMKAAELTEKERNRYGTDEKLKLITGFMEEEGYERVFGNVRFAVYITK